MYQNLWNGVKAVLRGNFVTLNAIKKEERLEMNYLSFYLKKLEIETEGHIKPKRKEIRRINKTK